jgi:CheY-like chemotaxis protein
LCFPRIDHRATTPAVEAAASSDWQAGGTILLVEDEEAVRGFLRAVLQDCRYKVLEADTGAAALLLAEKKSDHIHLLITDVLMPGMNGRELAERLRHQRPDLKAIFLSGYSTDVIAHSGVLDRDVAFLQKPVSPEALASKVREVLAGSGVRQPS